VVYQVQCRLSEVAPVRAKGVDHTTQGAYAVAAGVSKALGLSGAGGVEQGCCFLGCRLRPSYGPRTQHAAPATRVARLGIEQNRG